MLSSSKKCANCPVRVGNCLGESVSRLCELAEVRDDYRRRLVELSSEARIESRALLIEMDEALSRINRCSRRGMTLPHFLQADCGCSELTECLAGRGAVSGRVTLQDCLACVSEVDKPCPASLEQGSSARLL